MLGTGQAEKDKSTAFISVCGYMVIDTEPLDADEKLFILERKSRKIEVALNNPLPFTSWKKLRK